MSRRTPLINRLIFHLKNGGRTGGSNMNSRPGTAIIEVKRSSTTEHENEEKAI